MGGGWPAWMMSMARYGWPRWRRARCGWWPRLGIPEYAFDSCGVSGVVLGWSPDGSSILVSYTDYFRAAVFSGRSKYSAPTVRTHGCCGTGTGERGFKSQVTASWLNDGDVMLVALGDDEISAIKVQRGDPWAVFPGERVTLPRPDVQLLFSPRSRPVAPASRSPRWTGWSTMNEHPTRPGR